MKDGLNELSRSFATVATEVHENRYGSTRRENVAYSKRMESSTPPFHSSKNDL